MSPELARFIAEIPAAVALFDRDLRYLAASAAWLDAFGLKREDAGSHRHDELCDVARDMLLEVQRRALSGETIEDQPILPNTPPIHWNGRPASISARPHRDSDGAIAGVVLALRDASAAAKGGGIRDPLTGLAGREEFAGRLRRVLADPDPDGRSVVLFAIHLDSFRNLHNLYGGAIADEVLKVTAERLVAGTRSRSSGDSGPTARRTDMVARLGPDQFGIMCGPPAIVGAKVGAVAARLLRIVQNPIAVNGCSLRLIASLGFVTTGESHADENDAMRDLDFALQQAQTLGSGHVVAWQPALTRSAAERYSLAEQLRRAVDHGEFVLHYQPILRLSDMRMVGAEALLRWHHPRDGLLFPAVFMPVLEETGLIVEVGCWVVREVVRQIESWHMLYGRHIADWISVNLSQRQLGDPMPLLATLQSVFEGGFSVHRLKLETTEAALLNHPETARTLLEALNGMDIGLAIDDFGTAYSSMTRLRHQAVDTLKIDADFVSQIGSPEGEKLVQALLDLGRKQGADIIAESIETPAQRDFLRASGCAFGQGYLFAEPMDGVRLGTYALTHAEQAGRLPPSAA